MRLCYVSPHSSCQNSNTKDAIEFVMSLLEKTPVISKRRQNESFSSKKKRIKTIKNVLTSSQAIYWPVVSENEKNDIIDELKHILKKNIDDKRSSIIKTKFKDFIKFGVNEVTKSLIKDESLAILLEADVPRVLVSHIFSLAAAKQKTILCLKDFNHITKNHFGFNSSIICFTEKCDGKFPKIIGIIKGIYEKNYRLIKEDNPHHVLNDTMEIFETETASLEISNDTSATDFIKFSSEEISPITSNRKKRKSQLSFQPLLIKKIKNNPNR